jgi:serine/threonine protein kinase
MIADAGTRLGRYEIRSPLGKGGMGEVYLAQDMQLDRTVALKILPENLASDQRQMWRFIHEAKAASALNHPNIITIHEIGQEKSMHFIATEFIDGVTLRQLMSDTQMTLRDIFDILIQVASALAAAHEAGIVHRDIKPENIMVRRDGYAKVLDFGIAKLIEKETEGGTGDLDAATKPAVSTNPGMMIGTVLYMSPEQARGLPVDTRTDIWSFGAVLYEMITGPLPFGGATASDVLAAILDREPQPLTRYVPAIPAEMERIVGKALTKEVEERYQTIKDLLIDLRRLKRQLKMEADLKRTDLTEGNGEAATQADDEQAGIKTANGTAVNTDRLESPPHISSAEYLISGVMRHKIGILIVLAILGVAISVAYLRLSGATAIDSIIVLPLENVSGDAGMEDFGDGITESVINDLSHLQNLRVVPRNTSFRYKGQTAEPQKIGEEQKVRAVLLGRVFRRGNTLVVKMELIDVLQNSQIWGEQFNSNQPDPIGGASMFALQEEFSKRILDELKVKLAVEGQTNK